MSPVSPRRLVDVIAAREGRGQNHVAATLGRIVLFGCLERVARDGTKSVEERPALVVRVHGPDPLGAINVQVFLDGPNDREFFDAIDPRRDDPGNVVHRHDVWPADDQLAPQVSRWRWPPRA